jgi:SNF2 family DNA or RNA helicase
VLTRDKMHGYQARAVDFVKDNQAAALWIDMGLGKTVSTLTALSDMLADGTIKKCLVVAPLRVATHTWPAEVSAWSHLSHLKLSVVAGKSATGRASAIKSKAPIHVINRENIPWLVDHLGLKSWDYDCVVIDESSSFKSSTSKRWKSMRKVLGKIDRMVQLTGTPAPNSLIELWPQLYLLDQGERLENTRGKFLQKYCRQVGNPSWSQYQVKPERVEAIYRAVSDVVLRMSASEYLELPERIDTEITVSLPAQAAKAYREIEKDFISMVDNKEITAVNAAVQINKLLQISNGAVYSDRNDATIVHDEKIKCLNDLIDSLQEPMLIAYHYKHDLARLKKALPQAVELDKNPATIDRWNAGKIQILLAHPASAGHGLNLQQGGSVIVWFGLSWSLELYQQFNARLHRQGQTKPVRVHHILANTGADRAVYDVLKEKADTQNSLLNFVDKLKGLSSTTTHRRGNNHDR